MSSTDVIPAMIEDDPQEYENTNVHTVYDEIASHFSSTRYKPWPIIAKFLSSLPTGSVGIDSGTGNGKYLPLPTDRPGDIWTIGLDRSLNLLQIARTAGESNQIREVVWGDVLGGGWRPGAFDYGISIATIHHLATQTRRKQAVQQLIKSVSPVNGRVLIYVWAIEQDGLSKRKIPLDGAPSTTGLDVMVPWVLSSKQAPGVEPQVFNRYYHMFAKGELGILVCDAAKDSGLHVGSPVESITGRYGVEMIQEGWERSNYYIELRRWQT